MPVLKYTLPKSFLRKLLFAALLLALAMGGYEVLPPQSTFIPQNDDGAVSEVRLKSTFMPDSVTRLSDGDSMILRDAGKVRLVGVDCPESRQQGGKEATAFTRRSIDKRTIEIEICREDPQDRYGRKLVYLYYTDATGKRRMLNRELLRQGYARVYEDTPCLAGKEQEWKADYETARQQRRGLFATLGEVPDGKTYRRRHSR